MPWLASVAKSGLRGLRGGAWPQRLRLASEAVAEVRCHCWSQRPRIAPEAKNDLRDVGLPESQRLT